jgi:hypothetical protein
MAASLTIHGSGRPNVGTRMPNEVAAHAHAWTAMPLKKKA